MSTSNHAPALRTEAVAFSPVRVVLERARQLEAGGRDIVHFEIGEPDFDTPRPVSAAAIDALNDNQTHYGPNKGLLSLRRAISARLDRDCGLSYSPDEIIVTAGAAEGLFAVMLGYLNPGDEAIVFTPAFMNYENCARLAGATPVCIRLREEDGFAIRPEAVRAALTPRTKMIIVNNPHNPTGTVFSGESLAELARIATENDLLVLSDEIYDQIVYGGASCRSIATFPGMRERTLVVNGFSKCYAMTGWRLGYIAADAALLPPALKLHQYILACAPTFPQAGLAAAMDDPAVADAVRSMVTEFAERRDILLDGVSSIPKLSINRPTGAFYAMVNVSGTGMDGEKFALRLLEEHGVATVPCAGFGRGFESSIRISYAAGADRIREGLARMAAFVNGLRHGD